MCISSVKVDFIRVMGFVNTCNDKKIVVQGIFDDYSYFEIDWFTEVTELIGIGKFSETRNYTRKI
jgi:hypothetical protein